MHFMLMYVHNDDFCECAPSEFSTNVCRVYFVDKSNGSSQINRLSSEFSVHLSPPLPSSLSLSLVPAGSPSRGGDVTVYV